MEIWMIVTLLVVLGTITLTIGKVVSDTYKQQAESEAFLEEANELLGLKPDLVPQQEYNARKEQTFQRYKGEKHWTDERYTDDLGGDPAGAWQRELPTKETASLKAALVKRTVAMLPLMAWIQQEAQQKFALFSKGLISEKQMHQILKIRNFIHEESTEIRHDAECLQTGYGHEGQVFKEAATFYQHIMEKNKMEDMQRMRQRAKASA